MEMPGKVESEIDSSAISTAYTRRTAEGRNARPPVHMGDNTDRTEVSEHLHSVPQQKTQNMAMSGLDSGNIDGTQLLQRRPQRGHYAVKRALELFVVVAFSIPVLLLTAILTMLLKLESRGPIIYRQERIGQGGHRFHTWKFRTMVDDAEAVLRRDLEQHSELREEWERHHKLRSDPRITRVGKFLRKTSLDELPQLWNVLKGEMSLVGPRPIVEEETARYGDHLREYLQVRPGLTGLWQVSGRNDTSYEERVALDVYYVRKWSVWLDVRIMAQTVGVVLRGKGAY